MKAICIRGNHNWTAIGGSIISRSDSYFTIGKVYDYKINKNGDFIIFNDKGIVILFIEFNFKKNFKDVSEIRNEKLTELGI